MPKVLIAEDDLMIADMAEDMLVAHGYDVCGIGRTVAEAAEIAWRHRPDLADRKSTRLNSSHSAKSRMPSSA